MAVRRGQREDLPHCPHCSTVYFRGQPIFCQSDFLSVRVGTIRASGLIPGIIKIEALKENGRIRRRDVGKVALVAQAEEV